MKAVKIKNVRSLGIQKTKDITVDSDEHLFFANGIAVSNSHAVSYAMFSAWQLYLKAYYFPEFMCCLLMRTPRTKEDKKGQSLLDMRVKYARRQGLKILPPDINTSEDNFSLKDGGIRFGLGGLKGISSASEEIVKHQPYKSFDDFIGKVNKTILHKGRVENLILAGCFDCFCKDDNVYGYREELFNYYKRSQKKKENANQQFFDFFQEIVENDESYVVFSEEELIKKEVEMLGMELVDDLRQKYALYLKEHPEVKTIREVKEKGTKYPFVFCAVKSYYCFTSKKNVDWCKVQLTDGVYEAGLLLSKMKFESRKKYFQKRNVLVLPAVVSDNGYDYFLNEKEDIKIVKDIDKSDVEVKKTISGNASIKPREASDSELVVEPKRIVAKDKLTEKLNSSFNHCLKQGEAGEDYISDVIFPKVSIVNFEKMPVEKQNTYGDFKVEMEWGDVMYIEIKTDKYETGNFFIETESCEQTNNKGWLYKYDKVDNIFYHFPNDRNRLFSFSFQKFKKWCLDDKNIFKYKKVEEKKSGEDKTVGRLLPIGDALKQDWLREWDWKEERFK